MVIWTFASGAKVYPETMAVIGPQRTAATGPQPSLPAHSIADTKATPITVPATGWAAAWGARLAIGLAAVSWLGGCGSDCTDIERTSIRVVLTDGVTGKRVCDATVTAHDDPFSELLVSYGEERCSYSGVFERPSSNRGEVEHPDYEPAEQAGIVVEAGACNVVLEEVTFALEPKP